MSEVGELTIKFNQRIQKPHIILPQGNSSPDQPNGDKSGSNDSRALDREYEIKEVIKLKVLNDEIDDDMNRFIKDYYYTGSDETSLTIKIEFEDAKSISHDFPNFDVLLVEFKLPRVIKSVESGLIL